ncbi:uncharacterized protein LOC129569691 [Sitodiplosis mosellana]|uniref:uncharacterized protein LOC129569691 n=1 Tax=Sitodiplosis mosellana TaxID=263140 RepID=UPI002444A67D|nr:uncharacterized protein LOC129569691 [Sitodiplosis mosellana]
MAETVIAKNMRFYGVIFVLCIFLGVDFVQSFEGCANRFESYFPKCNCTGENIGWSFAQQKCTTICPSIISQGKYPDCKCRFGDEYDNKTNSCPNPICPPNTTADSVYPNCKCTEKNFEYNDYFNVCGRVCPENSTGRFPNCKCDDALAGFSKTFFVCKRCPPGSKPDFLYPNCKSATNPNATFGEYQNIYTECPPSTYGTDYDCHCKNGNIFKSGYFDDPYERVDELDGYLEMEEEEKEEESESKSNSKRETNSHSVSKLAALDSDPYCSHCPNPNEVFPNCTCEEGKVFDGLYCRRCPPNASGLYGECKCEGQATYLKEINRCRACPKKSTGKYPNCVCEDPLFYDTKKNKCIGCPEGTTGQFPNCRCQNETAVFVPPWKICRECPENSAGRFPDCTCTENDHIYSAYINECYIECGNGTGIHPKCYCGQKFDRAYDVETRFCKPISYSGRSCPPGSVGIAPDCRCAHGNFLIYGWGCFHAYVFGPTNFPCDKWPQCDLGIDRNTLLSLVG